MKKETKNPGPILLPPGYDGKIAEYESDACECGQVELFAPEELRLIECYIDPWELADYEKYAGPEEPEDEKYYYSVPAVDLAKSCCDSFDPEGILIYLPNEKRYGT